MTDAIRLGCFGRNCPRPAEWLVFWPTAKGLRREPMCEYHKKLTEKLCNTSEIAFKAERLVRVELSDL